MDYLTVNQVAFLSASIATFALFIVLVFQSYSDTWKRTLLIGFFGQLFWSVAVFSNYSTSAISTNQLLLIEHTRFSLWHITLFLLLFKRTPIKNWPNSTKFILGLAITANALSIYGIFSNNPNSTVVISTAFAILSVLGLVITEQVVRNLNTHRLIKILGICLTTLFAFDTLVYGLSTLNGNIPAFMWQTRAALALAVAFSLSLGSLVFNQSTSTSAIFSVSRPAAFYSSTIVLAALIIATFSIGSIYFEKPSFLASYIFTLTLLAGLLLLAALTISRQFRQKVDVFFGKHFFSLQYDYRQEWLSATRRISDLSEISSSKFYDEVLSILCNAIKAKSGSLWLNEDSRLIEKTSTLYIKNKPEFIDSSADFVKTMLKENWIFAPNSNLPTLTDNNNQLPDWIKEDKSIWMVAPLVVQMKLVGFVIIKRPSSSADLTYEDRDLMTNVAIQLANQIRLQQQETTISQAKQLETYNRMSAFIMHDTNNVIAQLALIVKNAQRHKTNPAFIEDMISTVENSVNRMKGLVQKFNPNSVSKPVQIMASDLIHGVIDATSDKQPPVSLTVTEDFSLHIDKQKLMLAIKNIVRNAQEASDEDGSVAITVEKFKVTISDTGGGMSESFIKEKLFHPFSTTKSENGIGIGAYLTKSYIEEIGASLKVISQENVGSTFIIQFPGEVK